MAAERVVRLSGSKPFDRPPRAAMHGNSWLAAGHRHANPESKPQSVSGGLGPLLALSHHFKAMSALARRSLRLAAQVHHVRRKAQRLVPGAREQQSTTDPGGRGGLMSSLAPGHGRRALQERLGGRADRVAPCRSPFSACQGAAVGARDQELEPGGGGRRLTASMHRGWHMPEALRLLRLDDSRSFQAQPAGCRCQDSSAKVISAVGPVPAVWKMDENGDSR